MNHVNIHIPIPNRIGLNALYGPNDINLKQLRKDTNAKISTVGGFDDEPFTLSIFGEEKEVERLKGVVDWMIASVDQIGYVEQENLTIVLMQSKTPLGIYQDENLIFGLGKQKIFAMNQKQTDYVNSIHDNIITFAIGAAGTAKTFLATVCALKALHDKDIRSIVITRPPVALDGLDMGFMPGTAEDKLGPWLGPVLDVFSKFYSSEKIADMVKGGRIKMIPLAFFRGYSFDKSFIIVDEAQNIKTRTFKAICSRIGHKSKMVICGDSKQSDTKDSGLERAAKILSPVNGVNVVRFGQDDIVRSGITADVIKAFEENGY